MKTTIISICLISCLCCQSQTIIFVDKYVSGGQQNGVGWSNAFPELQQALAIAADGDQIWVATGTYYPTNTTDRAISFTLKQGVRMYGGFNGTETALGQRNYELNETILSGNIGSPNGSDNSYHVLYGTGVDSTTVLDGFIVTRGGATDTGLPISMSSGGGLYLEPSPDLPNTCPVIQNCRFEINFASSGGAIFCSYDYDNTVNPILRNCQFVSNRASTFGGALYKDGPALPEQPFLVENCLFLKNAVLTSEGGGAFLTNTGNTTIFRNCTFEKDSAFGSWGAGLYYAGFSINSDGSKLVLDSCNFRQNYGSEGTGFTFVDFTDSGAPFNCEITGCLFDGNKTRNGDAAAILLIGLTKSRIKAFINNTIFTNNLTFTYSTTLIQGGFDSDLEVTIGRCKYINNRNASNPNSTNFAILAGVGGGESKCRVAIADCLFAHNGGGVAILNNEASNLQSNITNCTFYRNNKFIVDKSWYPGFDTSDVHRNDCYITNCVFWEPGSAINQMFTNNDFMNVNMYDYYIEHCMVSLTDSIVPGGPEAFGDHVFFGTYPMFADTANNDFRLLPCSPAVNKGNNLVVDSIGLTIDLDGKPRIFRDTVDLGAYEVPDTCLIIGSVEPFSEQTKIVVIPNPTRTGQLFSIIVPEYLTGTLTWHITDAYGKQVTNGSLSSSGILTPSEPGLYFLYLQGKGRQAQCKIIVYR